MKYLLDTNTFSDVMAEHPKIGARVASLSSAHTLAICSIVRGEILYGIKRLPDGRRREELLAKATRLFDIVQCEAIPETVADRYADVKVLRERAGIAIDENDLWIAATALAVGATLVTRDGDFQGIAGLSVEDWTV